jgi:hypothetical protein
MKEVSIKQKDVKKTRNKIVETKKIRKGKRKKIV